MTGRSFDWTLVRSYIAVLEAGSMMGAARHLGAHQPTLSRQVAELEAQLGTPLFERTGRGVAPTAAGMAIAEAARTMRDAADTLAMSAAGLSSVRTGTVRITTSHIAAAYLLPSVITELGLVEPNIVIDLVGSDQLTNLLRREADIAIRFVRPKQTSIVAQKVAEVAIVACAHERYLERAGTPRVPTDLLGHRLIGYDANPTIVRGLEDLGLPVARERFSVRTDDTNANGRLVAAAAGIGFVPAYNLHQLPGVVQILPALPIPALPCWLAVHREIRGNPLVRRVFDYLAHSVPEHLAARERLVPDDPGRGSNP